jgi:hypothetical protein
MATHGGGIGITRFKQARSVGSGVIEEVDGPVSGAFGPVLVTFNGTGAAGGTTVKYKIDLPPGMRYRITHATFRASAVGGTPTIVVGTIANNSALVASTNLSSNLGNLTVKAASQNYVQDAMMIATVTINTTNTVRGGVLALFGHMSTPPTTLATRYGTHF